MAVTRTPTTGAKLGKPDKPTSGPNTRPGLERAVNGYETTTNTRGTTRVRRTPATEPTEPTVPGSNDRDGFPVPDALAAKQARRLAGLAKRARR